MKGVSDFHIGKDLEMEESEAYMYLILTHHPNNRKGQEIGKQLSSYRTNTYALTNIK